MEQWVARSDASSDRTAPESRILLNLGEILNRNVKKLCVSFDVYDVQDLRELSLERSSVF